MTDRTYWPLLFPAWTPEAPVIVEIGSGSGEYLSTRAAADTHAFFIGTDRLHDRCKMHARLADKKKLQPSHYKVIFGDIERWLITLPPGSVDEFISLYPDPWPKRRHSKNRLFGPLLLPLILSRLALNGTWLFATDMKAYWELAQKTLILLRKENPGLSWETRVVRPDEREPLSQFERR